MTRTRPFAALALLAASLIATMHSPRIVHGVSPNLVISQVYGGGGNSGAPFTNDFIELFNRGTTSVNLSGWSIQYASLTGTTWQKTDLTGLLGPGQYFLIQQSGGATGAALPAPDATGTIAMAATAGKVALLNVNTLIVGGTVCPTGASVVDVVGYGGGTNCFEGAPTAAPSNTTAVLRTTSGCSDTDNNNADFAALAPNPRNTTSPLLPCNAPAPPTGTGAANPNPTAAGNAVLLTVTVTPGINPPSTGIAVTANLTMIGGAATQQFFDDGTNGDDTANDGVFSFQALIPLNATPGAKTLPAVITDAQNRSSNATISFTVLPPAAPGNVVVSQIFGGGGNSDAPFTHDFVELFNRSSTPVSIAGWSVQYASAAGASWQRADLTGLLAPGQYFLVQLASSGANGVPLPAPDAVGTINMSSTGGKVALVNNAVTITGTGCPSGASLVDFVGYGSSANCFEGPGPTPATSSTNAALRRGGGCADTNNNALNFTARPPAPRNTASPRNVCGGGANLAGFTLRLSDPASCTGAGNVVNVEVALVNTGNRAQTDNPGAEFSALLPAAFIALNQSCTATAGQCVAVNETQLEWNGGVPVGQTVTIRFQAQIRESVAANASLCVNSVVNFDSDNDELNDATATASACLTANCPPVGPGAAFPARAESSDQKAGSVLVFPIYSSDSTNLSRENTRINLTNTNAVRRAVIHLFFVNGGTCDVTDAYLCLTPNQTVSFLASDIDPDSLGYLVAVTVDERLGCPINFNFLVGDEFVKLASGHAANLGAEAFAALVGAPPACDGNTVLTELKFDGIAYNAAPRTLAVSNVPSVADGNATLLVINRLGGSLGSAGVTGIGQIFGIVYDDAENAASFEFNTTRCLFRAVLSNTFPRLVPRFPNFVPAGRSGWMKFYRSSDGAIIGAALNFNANAAVNGNAFNQGRNLHHLTLTTDASFVMPIVPPHC